MVEQTNKKLNRREVLNLAWLASLGFLLVDLGGVTYLFALPRFRQGQFGGQFSLGQVNEALPQPGGKPVNLPKGMFWLSRTQSDGVLALYKVCTHLGCLYNWADAENKFICPCHGSQFQLDGTYIQGPAPRSLDRFTIHLVDAQGNEVLTTDQDGNPIPLHDEELYVVVDTGQLIRGKTRGIRYPVNS